MLNDTLKKQLGQYLQLLEGDVVITASTDDDKASKDMMELLNEVEEMSSHIILKEASLKRTPSFTLSRPEEEARITFAGVPLGHEFTSFVLALLQVSGRAPKEEQSTLDQISKLDQPLHFETYISLTCTKCPDVVQALNLMSVVNPNITHTMIDGAVFREESKDIMAVPTIMLNGEEFGSGRMTVDEIVAQVGGGLDTEELNAKEEFEVLVIGGGPASAAAAIYAARKGLRTGMVAERIGGQVNDTAAIENLIGIKETTGPALSQNLAEHIRDYEIDVMTAVRVSDVNKVNDIVEVELENGAKLTSKTLIIGTGAKWRNMNVPGEEEYKNKGVAYCPHCDGPLFEGKRVAVVGGGNSGVEAAIDLAGITEHVTLLEFGESLRADAVLQERLASLPNSEIITQAATKELTGTDKLNKLTYTERHTGEEKSIDLEGVFVQIGLVPNTEFVGDKVARNERGEIIVDRNGATNVPGIFAAGDCTDQTFKQIIISMGSGATAALSAFDYLIRH
ncbi:alkyl hydroperoxide reductase subunit F [Macrococcus hajekii]|uniref:Alkyl hydroperoxide reductase subunit F n=1 Tax=Macrococcus hajekii TaxID=198482 RepID=A0A4R6BJQ4_9STAP|nr:alkyl hydroperoxide reductase subunit F [Macrococcus hajekii]TDM01942.1 alkyl hydroperoxide reductase subunit F [Macrococcus hajekii]GGB08724.1 alkyl hydroperoxide reductase subunit F [Macrococcus hajekii]